MRKLVFIILILISIVVAFVVGGSFVIRPSKNESQAEIKDSKPVISDSSENGSEIKDEFSATLKDQRGGDAEGIVLFTTDPFLNQGRYMMSLKNLPPLVDNQHYEAWIQTKAGIMENLGIVDVRDGSIGFLESIGRKPGDGDNIVITLWRGVEDVGGQPVLSGRLE